MSMQKQEIQKESKENLKIEHNHSPIQQSSQKKRRILTIKSEQEQDFTINTQRQREVYLSEKNTSISTILTNNNDEDIFPDLTEKEIKYLNIFDVNLPYKYKIKYGYNSLEDYHVNDSFEKNIELVKNTDITDDNIIINITNDEDLRSIRIKISAKEIHYLYNFTNISDEKLTEVIYAYKMNIMLNNEELFQLLKQSKAANPRNLLLIKELIPYDFSTENIIDLILIAYEYPWDQIQELIKAIDCYLFNINDEEVLSKVKTDIYYL